MYEKSEKLEIDKERKLNVPRRARVANKEKILYEMVHGDH